MGHHKICMKITLSDTSPLFSVLSMSGDITIVLCNMNVLPSPYLWIGKTNYLCYFIGLVFHTIVQNSFWSTVAKLLSFCEQNLEVHFIILLFIHKIHYLFNTQAIQKILWLNPVEPLARFVNAIDLIIIIKSMVNAHKAEHYIWNHGFIHSISHWL